MQRPRHRDHKEALDHSPERGVAASRLRLGLLRLGLLRLGLLVLAVAVLAGCREDPSDSADEFQRKLDSTGRRVLIVDADGKPLQKLRVRRDSYKVYDKSLAPVGQVRWERLEDGDAARAKVQMRTLADTEPTVVEQVSEGNFEMPGHFRIERADRGWAVLDAQANLVGVFERHDEAWQLRRRYDDDPVFSVADAESPKEVLRDGQTELQLQTGELSELELLAVELDGLGPLERTAVGVWMEHARPLAAE